MKKIRETSSQKRPPPPAQAEADHRAKEPKNFLDTQKKSAQQLRGRNRLAAETKIVNGIPVATLKEWPKGMRGSHAKILKGPPQVIYGDDDKPTKGRRKTKESSSLMDEGGRLKRKYRRAAELPDPTQAPDAEVNRAKQQVKLRLDPKLIARLDEAANDADCHRNTLIENILKGHFQPK